jgi:hypothetical protein
MRTAATAVAAMSKNAAVWPKFCERSPVTAALIDAELEPGKLPEIGSPPIGVDGFFPEASRAPKRWQQS